MARSQEDGGVTARPIDVVALGFWLGTVVGPLELASLVLPRTFFGIVTYDTLRTNWHFAWMVPLSYLLLFGGAGLVLGVSTWPAPRRPAWRWSVSVLGFLAACPLVMMVPGIHRYAVLALALGVACQAWRWLGGRVAEVRRVVWWSLPVLVPGTIGLMVWQYVEVSGAERRALAARPAAAPGAPNVLLIVLDTARADSVFPAAESGRVPMPFLSRLAARGVRFDEARSTAPWTLPSHASLFTGRWPHELSARLGRRLDATHPTLAEHLASRGYATAAFVANTHNGNAWYGLDRGFARYEDHYENTRVSFLELLRSSRAGSAFLMSRPGQRAIRLVMVPPRYMYRKTASMIGADTLAWLDRHPERPYFVFLNYYDAHDPYLVPAGAPQPFSRDPVTDDRPVEQRAHDAYDDCLAYLDGQLEALFGELERRGAMRNTLVVITSDHGEGFGEHRLSGHGVSLYRPETHIPLLVLCPDGAGAGRRVSSPVSLRDVPATIVDLAGATDDSTFPGRPLRRFWNASTADDGLDPVLVEASAATAGPAPFPHAPIARGLLRSVTTDGHVFIRNGDGAEELYRLDDVEEAADLAPDPAHRAVLDDLRTRLDRLVPGG